MGAKAPQAQSSAVQFDGAMNVAHNIGRIAYATTAAQDNLMPIVAHGPVTIKKLLFKILASTTASTATIKIGDASSASAYHGPINFKNQAAGAVVEVDMTASLWVKKTMEKGDYLKLLASAAGTAVIAGVVVLAPTSGESDS